MLRKGKQGQGQRQRIKFIAAGGRGMIKLISPAFLHFSVIHPNISPPHTGPIHPLQFFILYCQCLECFLHSPCTHPFGLITVPTTLIIPAHQLSHPASPSGLKPWYKSWVIVRANYGPEFGLNLSLLAYGTLGTVLLSPFDVQQLLMNLCCVLMHLRCIRLVIRTAYFSSTAFFFLDKGMGLWGLGSGQRYQILLQVFVCCANQKTHGHVRIARISRKHMGIKNCTHFECENCTRFACNSCMSVCFLASVTCKKVWHKSYTLGHCLVWAMKRAGQTWK